MSPCSIELSTIIKWYVWCFVFKIKIWLIKEKWDTNHNKKERWMIYDNKRLECSLLWLSNSFFLFSYTNYIKEDNFQDDLIISLFVF